MTTLHEETGLAVVPPGMDELVPWLLERGLRFEVIDGTVVVRPVARLGHERLVMRLLVALGNACPPGIDVLPSNYQYRYAEGSYTYGDITVVRTEHAREEGTYLPPLLVVEVRSPSTDWLDRGRKREIYAEGGVASYWRADPEGPSLQVLTLRGDTYVETARLDGPGVLHLDQPFPVDVTLVDE